MTTAAVNQQAVELDAALVELLDLGLQAKHAQWNLVGPRFGPMRQLLDELAGAARESADRVAERAVVLGHPADGRSETITALTSLPRLGRGPLGDLDAILAVSRVLDAVATRLHSASDAFEEDLVTVELFTGVLAVVERFAWMLRAQRTPQ